MEVNEQDLAVYIGKKIKEFRKNKKLTQKELGKLIDKSDNTISNYETGAIAPSQDALFAIAHALDIKTDDLFPPRSNDKNSLEQTILMGEGTDLSIDEINFLNNLIDHASNLTSDERKILFGNIQVAIELFNKTNK